MGVDLLIPEAPATDAAPAQVVPVVPPSSAGSTAPPLELRCPHEDCAQPNPPGSTRCLYCDRPMLVGPSIEAAPAESAAVLLPPVLQARFRVLQVLPAAGAEAELLLVQPLSGGTPCMAKVYRRGILPQPQVRERAARLSERHRVQVIDEGLDGGLAYEVMEYCREGSLRDWLRSGDPLPLTDVVRQLAEALQAVHAQGLVHRDLKPENVLVRARHPMELVLTDFGIASVLESTQRFTGHARTLLYASPESLSGLVDSAYDYWSLGMIVLEASLGAHPFAGLSDAVVLHHLVTRSVGLDGVTDVRLRKLLRGLLLRDPRQRWGAESVRRWLANDVSLPEPHDASATSLFAHPYRIHGEVCTSTHQLAAALSRHWEAGVADVINGQLLAWLQREHPDQDLVRLLSPPPQPVEAPRRLLQLLLALAPGLPAQWRGQPLDLRSVLSTAARALQGDARSAQWLQEVHDQKALQVLADAADDDAQALQQRWAQSVQAFVRAWQDQRRHLQQQERERHPDRVVEFDSIVFGRTAEGTTTPDLAWAHPRLLALSYDRQWPPRLRERIQARLSPLILQCPWLQTLGDPAQLDSAALLAIEAHLPELQRLAQQHQDQLARRDQARQTALEQQAVALLQSTRSIAALGDGGFLGEERTQRLQEALDAFDAVLETLRAQTDDSSERATTLRRRALRLEPLALRMRRALQRLEQRRAFNSGLLTQRSAQVLAFVVGLVFVIPVPGLGYVLAALVVGVLAWRLLPNRWLAQEIRALAQRFED